MAQTISFPIPNAACVANAMYLSINNKMVQYKYILEQYKGINSRFECPSCGKQRVFTRYIDTETGKHLHSTVGRCNRESNCGAHYKPKQYFQDNNLSDETTFLNAYLIKKTYFCPPHSVSFIPFPFFETSLKRYSQNNFITFLTTLFGEIITNQLIKKYFIGTSKYWNGATVFWQRNLQKEIRTGKIMLYSPLTGKRIKEPNNHIQWAHKVLRIKDYDLKQCFFGEHLLGDKTKPVAIVESEKTAIIASVYLPQFIWIASGSLNNLNTDKCKVLKDRNIILFPDLNGFSKWESKAKELFINEKYFVSDLLEIKATEVEKKQGLDLADYLIKFHHTKFEVPNIIDFHENENGSSYEINYNEEIEIVKTRSIHTLEKINSNSKSERETQNTEKLEFVNWDSEILKLETYFFSINLRIGSLKLNNAETINDIPFFIKNHLATVKEQNGKLAFEPYLKRLQKLYFLLKYM